MRAECGKGDGGRRDAEKDRVGAEQHSQGDREGAARARSERERHRQGERDRSAPKRDRVLEVERRGDRRGEDHRRNRKQARAGEERRAEQPGECGKSEHEPDQHPVARLAREVSRVQPRVHRLELRRGVPGWTRGQDRLRAALERAHRRRHICD